MSKLLTIEPINKVNGMVNLPGSKSISNRILLLAALSDGTTKISNLLHSEDVFYMLNFLKTIGIFYKLSKNRTCCIIEGNRNKFLIKKRTKIFVGNSGTVTRFLTAILSLEKNSIILHGTKRMHERPIGSLVDSLSQGGSKIVYLKNKNFLPIKVFGGYIGGKIFLDCSLSSQFLTAILLMAPLAKLNTCVTIKKKLVSKPYVDMTLLLLKKFGINIKHKNYKKFYITGNSQYLSPKIHEVEGDASNASYFLSAAAIRGGYCTS